jgi:hypothetical protein
VYPVARAGHVPRPLPRVQPRLNVRNQAPFISLTQSYAPDSLGSVGASPAESSVSDVGFVVI